MKYFAKTRKMMRARKMKPEVAEDGPPGYEGREHVKYKDPGYATHEIRYPEDEPHMKSRIDKDEMHEAEDNYHMDVPDQTEYDLPKKIKRAHMLMEDSQEPKPLMGNMVMETPRKGIRDENGWEDYGPKDEQKDDESQSKGMRKKTIVAVMKRKMKKNDQ